MAKLAAATDLLCSSANPCKDNPFAELIKWALEQETLHVNSVKLGEPSAQDAVAIPSQVSCKLHSTI